MNAFLHLTPHCRSPPVLISFQMQLNLEMEERIMTDKEDKTVRQFVRFCRTALMYEKKNYYNEQKHRVEREKHIEMFSPKQSGMVEKIFDTYHADYFSVMGYEIGIIDGDLAQALREPPDKKIQIVLLYYFAGLSDREIGEIYGTGRSTICDQRNNAIKKLRLMMEEMHYGK